MEAVPENVAVVAISETRMFIMYTTRARVCQIAEAASDEHEPKGIKNGPACAFIKDLVWH